jgi:hypothetical protein
MDFLQEIDEGQIVLLPFVVRRVDNSTENSRMKGLTLEQGSFDKNKNFINDLRNTIGNSRNFVYKWLDRKDALSICEAEINDILKNLK